MSETNNISDKSPATLLSLKKILSIIEFYTKSYLYFNRLPHA